MNEYPIDKTGLPEEQIGAIVERGASIPAQYPIGSPGYIGLQLARQNYLLGVRNRHLRFMKWAVTGVLVFIIGGVGYLSYRLDKFEKKIERNNVALEQSVDEFSASFTSLGDTVKHFENSSYTSLGEISKSFEMIKHQDYQIIEELKKTTEELKNARKDLHDARVDLLTNLRNDLRDIRGDLESVIEPNSIK